MMARIKGDDGSTLLARYRDLERFTGHHSYFQLVQIMPNSGNNEYVVSLVGERTHYQKLQAHIGTKRHQNRFAVG